ncbi:peroxisomal dehydratase [Pseudohyphozyma bogoriensis]|nr:peroxisomal dehydratase [Pseudohyphozyma bogoriensis]
MEKAIGHVSEPLPVSWNQRDLLLYAVGIGAKRNELQSVYELSPDWHPFPTYPLVLGLKGDHTDVNDFGAMKDAGGPVPGLPKTDPKKGVHAEQSIEILKPIPAVSGEGWKINKKLVGLKDTGKGLIIDSAHELVDPKGEVYARMVTSGYVFGNDYGANGINKSIAPKRPLAPLNKPPAKKPDAVFSEKTTEEQAVLYRLSGDYNPLHAFPEIGKALGFPGAILHGLCSYGHAARAIVLNAAGGDGTRLAYMSARFTSPVMPGDEVGGRHICVFLPADATADTRHPLYLPIYYPPSISKLETSLWLSDIPEGTRVDFVQLNKRSGKLALGGGVALIKKKICAFTVQLGLTGQFFRQYGLGDRLTAGLVLLAVLNDTAGTMGSCAMVYEYMVHHWGDIAFASERVAKAFRFVLPVMGLAITFSLAGAIWATTITQTANVFVDREKPKLALTIWLISSAVIDVGLAAVLVIQLLLMRKATAYSDTRKRVTKIIIHAIETGSFTAVLAVGTFVAYQIAPDTSADIGIVIVLGRIYSITLLANLVARKPAVTPVLSATPEPEATSFWFSQTVSGTGTTGTGTPPEYTLRNSSSEGPCSKPTGFPKSVSEPSTVEVIIDSYAHAPAM